ncbi:hypothetical protein M407DRAFT_26968 [Tulasnella calospora MUT 4182]|uniref:Carbohydrate-binding module family 1 protein n=1 Tax=Tulasnella calospora MUT 4182 TaxID=1051891 RepID=A0A0C3QDC8_9AGAM|nr:carbohydrate-binding module family 1 protein [Tulasnella calospora MUT 4182]KIO23596.1 hypothetical protein M407DRAFT_26968 [Tulasnella calospora MUT 4182]
MGDGDLDSGSRHILTANPTTQVHPHKGVRNVEEKDARRSRMTPEGKELGHSEGTKKFGQAPPHALLQITTNNASSTKIGVNIDLGLSSTTSSLRRHSSALRVPQPLPTPTAESDPSAQVRRCSLHRSFVTPEANVVKMGLGDSSGQPSRVNAKGSEEVEELTNKRSIVLWERRALLLE